MLTDLEAMVLQRVADGEDPWYGGGGGVGSRIVSQALGRLQRKGMLYQNASAGPRHLASAAGRAALAARGGTVRGD